MNTNFDDQFKTVVLKPKDFNALKVTAEVMAEVKEAYKIEKDEKGEAIPRNIRELTKRYHGLQWSATFGVVFIANYGTREQDVPVVVKENDYLVEGSFGQHLIAEAAFNRYFETIVYLGRHSGNK